MSPLVTSQDVLSPVRVGLQSGTFTFDITADSPGSTRVVATLSSRRNLVRRSTPAAPGRRAAQESLPADPAS